MPCFSRRLLGAVFLVTACTSSQLALAQLRIVTYNTANGSFPGNDTSPRSGMNTVLQAIADEVVNGISKPIDALIFQEHANPATTTQEFVNLLNDIYGAGTYARSTVLNAPSSSSIHQTLVYNTETLQLISEQALGSPVGGFNQPERQPVRFEMRPVGYDSSSDFLIYNSHYKAGSSSNDQNQRTAEAQLIRADADAQGQGKNIIYAGDYNIQSSSQAMYQELLSTGNGQAFDPIATPGSWNNNFSFRATHTQNSTDGSSGLSTFGGLDDRFDFQLVTSELLDNEGLSYISGSYHAFGNNGTTFNQAINAAGNTYPLTSGQLDDLAHVSDHLPVVADYQVPAILSAQLASLPSTVPLGALFNVDVLVANAANVVSSLGADELDYTISVSGDLFGSATGTDFALGGSNAHPITLDTSVQGVRSGIVTVATTSQGAANPLVTIPLSFVVGQVNQIPFQARDDFDSPVRLNSFVQSPEPGAFVTSLRDGFERYQVGVSATIPFALVDSSTSGDPSDTLGVVDAATKTDGWFGITDTVNDDNTTGLVTATWEFDITDASNLEISIDMAAMGDFEASVSTGDFFNWTYSIDGGATSALFTSSVDEAGSATYILADGDEVILNDPLIIANATGDETQLSNVFQTLTSILSGTGETLTITLTGRTDGGSEAFAFDNIVIDGITILTEENADFNQDGNVDGGDFLAWQRGVGTGTTLSEGDANNSGTVDAADLAIWQTQFGLAPLSGLVAVPEPSAAILMCLGAVALVNLRKISA